MAIKKPKFFIKSDKYVEKQTKFDKKLFVTEEISSKRNPFPVKRIIIVILALLLLGGIAAAGYFYGYPYLQKLQREQVASVTDVSKPSPKPPSPTPTPEVVDPGTYTIQILNGSGISGRASQAKTLLEQNKYMVKATGNADEFDYTKTEIRAKEDVKPAYLEQLKKVLAEKYVVASTPATLTAGTTDIVVVIGTEVAQ